MKQTDGEKIIEAIEMQLVKLGFEVDPWRDEKYSVFISYDREPIESWDRFMYLEDGDIVISSCDDDSGKWFVDYKICLADPSVTPKTVARTIAEHLLKEMDVVFKGIEKLRRKIRGK